ncbi:hypothetical protein OTSGILL_1109 [Orientia tsutsugamushi str. Gilliam]|uniref:Uncharacterized protein n=1 Tax=Orientia tsutsugamushi str. Gilliam TaxID=1359184 RepID=A0A0F3MB12_ORITS|nr:hypothetical protein [Orientia tsutsugamushi]KJV52958.1 hypothetical protein OTSGILL_1109 [Orientia tsutsugamushi str. Gilliam]SPR03964.1 Uncharacterised protein [Orientia tsutsugamushi str. Gilliam]
MFKRNWRIEYKINQALTIPSPDTEDYFTRKWDKEVVGYKYEDGSTILHKVPQVIDLPEKQIEVFSKFSKLKGINIISAAKNNDGHTFLHFIEDDTTKDKVKNILFGAEIISENPISNTILCMQKFIYNSSSKDNNTLVIWPISAFEFEDACINLDIDGGKELLSEKASNRVKQLAKSESYGYIKCVIENNAFFGFEDQISLSQMIQRVLADKCYRDGELEEESNGFFTIINCNKSEGSTNNICEAVKAKYNIALYITELHTFESTKHNLADDQVLVSTLETNTDHHGNVTICKSKFTIGNRLSATDELQDAVYDSEGNKGGKIDSSNEEYTANDLYENIRVASIDELIRADDIDNVGISCCIGEAV